MRTCPRLITSVSVALVATLTLAACGQDSGTSRATPTPAPDATGAPPASVNVTLEDDGTTVTIGTAGRYSLSLPDTEPWGAPAVDGDAVTLSPIESVAPTGSVRWSIDPVRPGTVEVTVPREPAKPFRVTVVVEP